jgi:hypothetical protein
MVGAKKRLEKVTAEALRRDANFLAQARNNLPNLTTNLEKLLKHY